MEAKHLRIGNFVDYEATTHVIEELHSDKVLHQWLQGAGSGYVTSYESIKGIELTPEWIINLGFKDEGNEIYSKGVADTSYCLQSRSKAGFTDGGYFMGIRFDDWDPDPITINRFTYEVKTVHHLQNLFFALTGRELELKK